MRLESPWYQHARLASYLEVTEVFGTKEILKRLSACSLFAKLAEEHIPSNRRFSSPYGMFSEPS